MLPRLDSLWIFFLVHFHFLQLFWNKPKWHVHLTCSNHHWSESNEIISEQSHLYLLKLSYLITQYQLIDSTLLSCSSLPPKNNKPTCGWTSSPTAAIPMDPISATVTALTSVAAPYPSPAPTRPTGPDLACYWSYKPATARKLYAAPPEIRFSL